MGIVQKLAVFCVLSLPHHVLAQLDEVCLLSHTGFLEVSRSKGLPFDAFMAQHGRTYQKGTNEYSMRSDIYTHRVQEVSEHNSNRQRRFDKGINHLSDRTDVELAELRGLRVVKRSGSARGVGVTGAHGFQALGQVTNAVMPAEKDWTQLEATLAEVDQGGCGSCWAVAAATVLRANAEIAGHNRTFSAQELVACVPNPHECGGQGGCKGSTVELAMNWVMEKGLESSHDTPYEGVDTKCKKSGGGDFVTSLLADDGHGFGDDHGGGDGADYSNDILQQMIAVGFHGAKGESNAGLSLGMHGWERLPENEYAPLMRAVAEKGPVAISVAAGDWMMYNGGIFDGCGKDAVIDHAVTLIGYGKHKETGDKFWTIKNSWGLSWGEKGNIRLLRHEGDDTYCGTDKQPEVGTACKNGPSSVKVCGMCGILYDSVVPHFVKAKAQ